ncbi:acetyltransferase, partial [candidate division KSB1 bacterium]|nr:acetyltransferase [candidate division KSB1 bacterium]
AEACECRIAGIIDRMETQKYMGYPILGDDDDAAALFSRYGDIPVVLTPDAPAVRCRLAEWYKKLGWKFATLVHPQAYVSRSARWGEGIVVQYGAHISACVTIGNYVKINTYANVMHDTVVGDYTTVAPNAVVLGRVKIGRFCYIGANATILPDKHVGEGAIVGAAAVVSKDVRPSVKVAGIPAREMR